jgi:thiol-disulfide isomerase/thioredoxin
MKKLLLAVVCLMVVAGTVQARELKPYKGGETPPLELRDLDGKMQNLQDYRGKVVLVNFWATWCPPCRAEMPSMQRLRAKLAGKPFVILAVDMGEAGEQVRAYLKEIKVDFTVPMDTGGKALKQWKVFAFPTSYLVDPDGKIRYALFGSMEWDDPQTVEKIMELMPKNQ